MSEATRVFRGSANICVRMLVLLVAACAPADAPPASADPAAETTSLLGESLYARADTAGAITVADAALAADSSSVDLVLAAAAARAEAWRYREAIALYTRAMRRTPEDWRLYRFRGHRFISLRRFEEAVRDLERAVQLEPRSFDAAYHLGLALFLSGRFQDAAAAYARCQAQAAPVDADLEAASARAAGLRSCSSIRTDGATRVAMTDWQYRALRRAGLPDQAAALLDAIEPGWELTTNASYYRNLLYYRGDLTAAQILEDAGPDERFETRAFGVANRMLADGDTAGAEPLLRRIAADPHWPGFGRIAAEVELRRLSENR